MTETMAFELENYHFLRLLGSRSFASVYLARHLQLNIQVAIKVWHINLTDENVENFLREAQAIASLIHPYIVRVLDVGVKKGIPFLVTDYMSKGSLRRRHPERDVLPLFTVVSYVQQVTEALQYAHRHNLTHGNIKPENMLLGPHNEVVLGDFNIPAIANVSSPSVPSLASEHMQESPYSAVDQYSLGAVVYEWLYGEPYSLSLGTAGQQMMSSPHEGLLRIPLEVEKVVLTALAKDPMQRFANMREFAMALEDAKIASVRQAAPIEAALVSRRSSPQQVASVVVRQGQSEPVRPGISRRTAVVGLGLAGLIIAGGGAAWPVFSRGVLSSLTLSHTSTPLGTLIYTYQSQQYVRTVAWSPDGRYIASGGDDTRVHVWEAATGTQVYIYQGHDGYVKAVAWSPDGKRIASGSTDGTVQVWDATDGGHVFTYRGHSDNSPTVQVWNAADGSPIFFYTGHQPFNTSYGVNTVAWSPNGKRIVSGCNTYSGGVRTVAWSPNGKRIASVGDSSDHTVQIWNAADGGHVFLYHGHFGGVTSIAWSPDSKRLATTSEDIQVWNAADGSRVFTYRWPSNKVTLVAWSLDGKHIASAGTDRKVQIWNAADGSHVYTYSGHNEPVHAAAWSPDGKHIVSVETDGIVQVWQAS